MIPQTEDDDSLSDTNSAPGTPTTPTLSLLSASGRTNSLANLTDESFRQILSKNENIVFTKLVVKRRRLTAKKRQLVLTDRPRLLYVDPYKMAIKGSIPWSKELKIVKRTSRSFTIQVPGRSSVLEDLEGDADLWVKAIESVQANQR